MTPPKTARLILDKLLYSSCGHEQAVDHALQELAELVSEQELHIAVCSVLRDCEESAEVVEKIKALITTKLGGKE